MNVSFEDFKKAAAQHLTSSEQKAIKGGQDGSNGTEVIIIDVVDD
ncbi:MAG: hypothetical protein NXI25_10035 [bacterium]|nr:hypothetical protein [bacterium]